MKKPLHGLKLKRKDDDALKALKKKAARIVGRTFRFEKRDDPHYLAWYLIWETIAAIEAAKRNVYFYMGCEKPNRRVRLVSSFLCDILPDDVNVPSLCALPPSLMVAMVCRRHIGNGTSEVGLPLDYLDVGGMPLGILFSILRQVVAKHVDVVPKELRTCVDDLREVMKMVLAYGAGLEHREGYEEFLRNGERHLGMDAPAIQKRLAAQYWITARKTLEAFLQIEAVCRKKSDLRLHEVSHADYLRLQRAKRKSPWRNDQDGRKGFASEGKKRQLAALDEKVKGLGGWDKVKDKLGLCSTILRIADGPDGYKTPRVLKATYCRHLKKRREMRVK